MSFYYYWNCSISPTRYSLNSKFYLSYIFALKLIKLATKEPATITVAVTVITLSCSIIFLPVVIYWTSISITTVRFYCYSFCSCWSRSWVAVCSLITSFICNTTRGYYLTWWTYMSIGFITSTLWAVCYCNYSTTYWFKSILARYTTRFCSVYSTSCICSKTYITVYKLYILIVSISIRITSNTNNCSGTTGSIITTISF